jgi:hypothetical protein
VLELLLAELPADDDEDDDEEEEEEEEEELECLPPDNKSGKL